MFFNTFIVTADSDGLKKFEEYCGLAAAGSLEERRKKVIDKWNEKVIYTNLSIYKVLNQLLGEKNYRLNLNKGDYEIDLIDNKGFIFTIEYKDGSGNVNEYELYKFLDRILPLNLIIDLMVDFLTNLELETKYTEDKYGLVFCGELQTGEYPYYIENNDIVANVECEEVYTQDDTAIIQANERTTGDTQDFNLGGAE